MLRWFEDNASRLPCKWITGHDEAFCSYAFHNQHKPFWAFWVRVFGYEHCRRSHARYH